MKSLGRLRKRPEKLQVTTRARSDPKVTGIDFSSSLRAKFPLTEFVLVGRENLIRWHGLSCGVEFLEKNLRNILGIRPNQLSTGGHSVACRRTSYCSPANC